MKFLLAPVFLVTFFASAPAFTQPLTDRDGDQVRGQDKVTDQDSNDDEELDSGSPDDTQYSEGRYEWTVSPILESELSDKSCGQPEYLPPRSVEIEDETITSAGWDGFPSLEQQDISALKADGSGIVTVKDGADHQWALEFEAGLGPRDITIHRLDSECFYRWAPNS